LYPPNCVEEIKRESLHGYMRSGGTTSQTDLRTLAKFQNEENENIKDPKMISDKAVDSSSIQDLLQSLDSEPER
jgi:hypothetical protein